MTDKYLEWVDNSPHLRFVIHSPLVGYLVCEAGEAYAPSPPDFSQA